MCLNFPNCFFSTIRMATLLYGDCLKQMALLPDNSVDCFICDLPYGQLGHNKGGSLDDNKYGKGRYKASRSECDWDIPIDLPKFWAEVERLSKTDHTPILHFCNTKFGIDLINSKPDWFRYDLVWNKERGVSFLLANKMPMKSHEMIYVFSKKSAYYKRIDIKGEFKSYVAYENDCKSRVYKMENRVIRTEGNDGTTRCPLSVINIRKVNTLGHPTEKPEGLYRWLLERYCPEGGCVLDPTAGSFNSIAAARDLGLKAIGIEAHRPYFWKAVARFSQTAKGGGSAGDLAAETTGVA